MNEDSSSSKKLGILYVVATPVGNLEDLTFRALKILKNVSFIACEDTRQTLKLLNKYGIQKKLISYYHPREKQKIPLIIRLLEEGKDGALVSNAGTPLISDPGYPLIREALSSSVKIIPIPGPAAVTTALSAAGLPTHRFLFLGFPPRKKTAVKKLLASVKEEPGTLIFYLPPRKLPTFLQNIQQTLGEREVVVARELTKIHEEFLRGTPQEILTQISPKRQKGESTLLIRGAS
ncbi:16S rRNA (cytidine(1402)-2'-O)-methyltransferase [bacterium]|nr:16S rRNA (cytidine(1402)-2'-O)-methyltransferase [bacterium]